MKVSIASQVMAMQAVRESVRDIARKRGLSGDSAELFRRQIEACFETLCTVQEHADAIRDLIKRGRE